MLIPAVTIFYLDPHRSCTSLTDFLAIQDVPLVFRVYDHPNGDCIVIAGSLLTDDIVAVVLQDWVNDWQRDDADYLRQLTRRTSVPS